MDRIWQWAWDRYGARYSWVVCAIAFLVVLPVYLFLSFVVLVAEQSDHYLEAAVVTVADVLVGSYVLVPVGRANTRGAEHWAAGRDVDRVKALQDTYVYARGAAVRGVVGNGVLSGVLLVVVGALAGATWSRLAQYGIFGAAVGGSLALIAAHSFVEGAMRPARIALGGDTGIGDCLPRSRPTFATWSSLTMLAVAYSFAVGGAMLAAVFDRARELPLVWVVIGLVLTLGFAVPITVGAGFSQSLLPIRDLAEGTERVSAGDYSQPLPVVQDDDLGALAASFNRMQAGLAERQRLQAAFGT